MKGDGGAVGLMENPAALLHWMVFSPEMAHMISDFKGLSEKRQEESKRNTYKWPSHKM